MELRLVVVMVMTKADLLVDMWAQMDMMLVALMVGETVSIAAVN